MLHSFVGLYLYVQPVCATCQNAGQAWPKMMFGQENLCDYSESATGSCGRVHSCAKAGTALGWCLIFILGCHQPNTELPSLPLAPGSASLGASSSSSVFVLRAPAWHLGQPGTGFGPTGVTQSTLLLYLPTARQGLGRRAAPLFGQHSALCPNSWKAAH